MGAGLRVGEFIGKGRRLQYCGLTHVVLENTKPTKDEEGNWNFSLIDNWDPFALQNYDFAASSPRPWFWQVTMWACLIVVWTQVMMAFFIDFITPPVGPGCWSLIFLVYGCLSTPAWLLQLCWEPRGEVAKQIRSWIAHIFNGLAIAWLVLLLVLFVGGWMSNCYCSSAIPGQVVGYGGYMDFETFDVYRDKFGLRSPWIGGVIGGSIVPIGSFFLAWFWWMKSKSLSAADESQWVGDTELAALMGPGLVDWAR